MHAMKVSVCLVENSRNEVIGIAIKRDLMGQKAVAYATQSGMAIAELSVRDVMIPRSSLYCISRSEARNADMGDVVETLKRIGDTYILITDDHVSSSIIHCVVSTQEVNQLLDTHLHLGYRAVNMMDMHFALSGSPADY
jgi:CBS domain containing-hemolysin-like protein